MTPISQPLTLFLVGATGDLAKKKIYKALFALFNQQLLPTSFTLIGTARQKMSTDEYRAYVQTIVQPATTSNWSDFAQNLFYVAGDAAELETATHLKEFYRELSTTRQTGNHLWYFATLPELYEPIIHHFKTVNLYDCAPGWTRIMLEKPFGTDLVSAQRLNELLLSIFPEKDILRLDHFLGKETVQNLLAFRFANGMFEGLWSSRFINQIQITSAETMGIAGRERFYDQTGTIRDVIQNHVLQMLAMTIMDEPASLAAADIHQQRQQLLDALEPITTTSLPTTAAFGQYQSGQIDGQTVVSYQQEQPQLQGSRTETAVALKVMVNSDRWRGMPIYLRAGKRLAQNVTEISLQFKEPTNRMFSKEHITQPANVLTFRIQPNEGVIMRIMVKKPGIDLVLHEVPLQFCYKYEFPTLLTEAYEKLIYDAVQGDLRLFPHSAGIETTWRYLQPLIDHQAHSHFTPDGYAAGSWGPDSFDRLLANQGHAWIEPSTLVCAL